MLAKKILCSQKGGATCGCLGSIVPAALIGTLGVGTPTVSFNLRAGGNS